MKVIVPIKQVYDPVTVRVSRSRGVLDTREAQMVMNQADRFALEEALRIKQDRGAAVTAITLGPPEAEDILREALAMGVDEAVLLTDEAFARVDASAAVMIVGEAIKRIGAYDLILTGLRSMGDGTGEFGPRLAGYLGLPQITRGSGLSADDAKLSARHSLSTGYALLEVDLPALVSVDEGANRPRYPSLPGSIAAYDEHTVTIWGAEDLGLTPEMVAQSIRTEVTGTFAGPERERGRVLSGEVSEAARQLFEELKARGLLGE